MNRIEELQKILPGEWAKHVIAHEWHYHLSLGNNDFEITREGGGWIARVDPKGGTNVRVLNSPAAALEWMLNWMLSVITDALPGLKSELETVWTVVHQDHDGTGEMFIMNHGTKEGALDEIRRVVRAQPEYLELAIEDGYDLEKDDDVLMLAEQWAHFTDRNEELELCSGPIRN